MHRVDLYYVLTLIISSLFDGAGDDTFHHLFQVFHLCFLATAVVHIRPVETMRNPYKYPDMFGYSIGVLFIALCNIYRSIEIMFKVVGDEAAAKTSERKYLVGYILQFICYLAASCVAGVALFRNSDELDVDATTIGGQRNMMSISNVCSRILSTQRRDLVDDSSSKTDTPILLCLTGWILSVCILLLRSFFFEEKDGGHKKHNVPMNIEYILHRFGELTMLLLGESVLSVLIVETTRTLEYHVTFYAGIVSLILMQYMHFKYQPHSADEHAFRKSVKCGAIFYLFCIIHAFSLIGVGTAYKMMLQEYSQNEKYRIRRLISLVSRTLAGGTRGVDYNSAELRQRVANMFCISMATSWLCLEGMYICHYGTNKYLSFVRCKWGKFVAFIRLCLIVIIATISQYVTEPEKVTLIGLALLCVAVATNEIGDYLWNKEFNETEHKQWLDETNESGVQESDISGKDTQHDAEYCI